MFTSKPTLSAWTPIASKGRRIIGYGWTNRDGTITLRISGMPAEGCFAVSEGAPLFFALTPRWWQRLWPF